MSYTSPGKLKWRFGWEEIVNTMNVILFIVTLGNFKTYFNKKRFMNQNNQDQEIRKEIFWKKFNTNVKVIFIDSKDSLTKCQEDSFSQLRENINLVDDSIISKVFEYYSELYNTIYVEDIKSDGYYMYSEIVKKTTPKPNNPNLLMSHYYPLTIYVPNAKDCELGYFGIYFDCTWDINNSLGVVIKNWKVFLVGNGDIAFLD